MDQHRAAGAEDRPLTSGRLQAARQPYKAPQSTVLARAQFAINTCGVSSHRMQPRERIELPCFLEMVRGQVRVPHCHLQARMPEDALQRQNVAAIHHEVAREGVAEYVSELSLRQFNACVAHAHAESARRTFKNAVADIL